MLRLSASKANSRKGSQASSVASSGGRARDRRRAIAIAHVKIDKLGKSLTDAVRQDDRDVVKTILSNDDELLAALEETYVDILHIACSLDRVECAAILLGAGAKINSLGTCDSSPLHISARRGNLELMALLMNFGANVNLTTRSEKRSPLHAAVLHGQTDAAKLLGENHARVDQRDIYGYTPLHLACKKKHVDLALWLLDRPDVDVNASDNVGWTSLHLVAYNGDTGMLRLLLDRHAFCDCQNQYGKTPLHLAATGGHVQVVQLLLEHRACIEIIDIHGKLAWEYTTQSVILQLLTPTAKTTNNKRETGLSSRLLEFISISQRLKPPIVVLDSLINDDKVLSSRISEHLLPLHSKSMTPSRIVTPPIIEEDETDFEVKPVMPVSSAVDTQNLLQGQKNLLQLMAIKLRNWLQTIESAAQGNEKSKDESDCTKIQNAMNMLQCDMSQFSKEIEDEIKHLSTNHATKQLADKNEKVLSPHLREVFLLSLAINIGRQSSGWLMLLENLQSLSMLTFDMAVARAKRLYEDDLCRTLSVLPTIIANVERDKTPIIKGCLDLVKKTSAIPKECELNIMADFLEALNENPPSK